MSIISNLIRIGLQTTDASPIDFTSLVPNQQQRGLGLSAEYFDMNASPRVFYVMNKALSGFDVAGGGGGGGGGVTLFTALSDAATADIPGTNALTAQALAAKLSNAVGWLSAQAGSTTNPTLVSGQPLGGAFAGTNAVTNISPGRTTLGTAVDGITSTVYGDVWIYGINGSATWSIYRATNGVAVPITANVTISTTNQDTYNGQVLDFQGAFTVTVNSNLVAGFGFAYIPPDTGTGTIASNGTTTFNGSTTSLTFTAASKNLGCIAQRSSSVAAYKVL